MKQKNIPLEYENPLVAVFLRTLAWEIYKANRENIPVWQQAEELVQAARRDLGLKATQGGAPHEFIQSLRRPENGFLTQERPDPVEDDWRDQKKVWRLLNLPNHRFVRMLSQRPIYREEPTGVAGFRQFLVSLRSAAAPKLLVTIGNERPTNKLLNKAPKGLYFLREADALYVGKSDEFEIRWTGHDSARTFDWWVFVAPVGDNDDNKHLSSDTIDAAEALLISFWKEICCTTNQNRGTDKEPVFAYLQPAILLVEAASAVLLWLIREKRDLGFKSWTLPFKDCQARGWPDCYNAFVNGD